MDVNELIREERVVRVRKRGFELVRSGGEINLVIDGEKLSSGNFRGVVAIVRFNRELHSRTQLGAHGRQLILRQTENYRDRLELGDDEKTVGVGSVHDVAGVHKPQTDAPADRSGDSGIC